MKSIKKYLLIAVIAALLLGCAFLVKAAHDAAKWKKLVDNFTPQSIEINLEAG